MITHIPIKIILLNQIDYESFQKKTKIVLQDLYPMLMSQESFLSPIIIFLQMNRAMNMIAYLYLHVHFTQTTVLVLNHMVLLVTVE